MLRHGGLLFAIPSFVWAMGGTLGAQSTVAPSLMKLAHDRVTWFVAVLWVTGFLKLFGALVGIGLTRRRARWIGRLMVFCGGGATVLLVWHGCLFVAHGAMVEAGALPAAPDMVRLTRWYLYLWGGRGSSSAVWPSPPLPRGMSADRLPSARCDFTALWGGAGRVAPVVGVDSHRDRLTTVAQVLSHG
ncbi:hypothetical protein GCM10020000_82190 [Streptomyces olivoverticillatus]